MELIDLLSGSSDSSTADDSLISNFSLILLFDIGIPVFLSVLGSSIKVKSDLLPLIE